MVTSCALLAMYQITESGRALEAPSPTHPVTVVSPVQKISWSHPLTDTLSDPLSTLLLQITSILFLSRAFAYLFRKLGQPAVIGEVAAGIVLGPSVMGWLVPGFSSWVFPEHSLPALQLLSQLGLVLFMFVVGMEVNLSALKNKAGHAIVISHANIVIPYTLGMALAYVLFKIYAPAGTSFLSFSLIIGIAMSITAFPVLARIIKERQMTETPVGNLAITCAAADDVTAWCILAAVISVVRAGSAFQALFTLALAMAYRITEWLNLRVEPKWHRFEFYYVNEQKYQGNQIISYNTMTLGLGLYGSYQPFKKADNFLNGILIAPSLRYWPTVGSTAKGNNFSYTNLKTGTTEEIKTYGPGIGLTPLVINVSIGYSFQIKKKR